MFRVRPRPHRVDRHDTAGRPPAHLVDDGESERVVLAQTGGFHDRGARSGSRDDQSSGGRCREVPPPLHPEPVPTPASTFTSIPCCSDCSMSARRRRRAGIGVVAIRLLLPPAIRRKAERRARDAAARGSGSPLLDRLLRGRALPKSQRSITVAEFLRPQLGMVLLADHPGSEMAICSVVPLPAAAPTRRSSCRARAAFDRRSGTDYV